MVLMAGINVSRKIINSRSLHAFWQIIDWIYPPACCSCNILGSRICLDCWNSIRLIHGETCIRCGDVVENKNTSICQRCSMIPPLYTQLKSFAFYEGAISSAVQSIKYKRNFGLVEVFILPLMQIILDSGWDASIICPVPLSEKRKRERGYNQTSLLAYWLGLESGIECSTHLLTRTKNTSSQVGLSREEREANVKDAFTAKNGISKGKTIIVVDDVATTGATLNACAQALLNCGAKQVYGLTIARATRLADKIQSI